MRFDLDEDRALLAQQTRELLERESPLETARTVMEDSPEGFSKALHASLAELGYLALSLPEEEGGMGAVALAAVLHEMGRVAFPGPFLDVLCAVRALDGCAHDAARALRERVVAGETLCVLARNEQIDGRVPETLETRLRDGRVTGTKTWVPFGAAADVLLVETREGLALVERPASGWDAAALPTLDHAQRFVEIRLDAPAQPVADPRRGAAILAEVDRLGALGAAAQLLGVAERALEGTVRYTSEREAFGAPIGSFQALQHRCADMLLQTESARSAVYRAAWALDHEPDSADYLVAVAKAWAGPAAQFVCGEAIQLHGGVGFTWEYDPHVFFKRVQTLAHFHGATREQLERVLETQGI
jgi:alkylation response protein AidB-like acyl-CoA dehydrogenase